MSVLRDEIEYHVASRVTHVSPEFSRWGGVTSTRPNLYVALCRELGELLLRAAISAALRIPRRKTLSARSRFRQDRAKHTSRFVASLCPISHRVLRACAVVPVPKGLNVQRCLHHGSSPCRLHPLGFAARSTYPCLHLYLCPIFRSSRLTAHSFFRSQSDLWCRAHRHSRSACNALEWSRCCNRTHWRMPTTPLPICSLRGVRLPFRNRQRRVAPLAQTSPRRTSDCPRG